MPDYHVEFHLPAGNRIQKRQALISCFLNEEPGGGRGSLASRYLYIVETYGAYGIYLKRPTQLNKGFDFTVNIKGVYFKKQRKYSNPSHDDIVKALSFCRENFRREYSQIVTSIINIYNCKAWKVSEINAYFLDYDDVHHPIQIILLAIKWLFMEQDCAYWNYSGRAMFFQKLGDEGLL